VEFDARPYLVYDETPRGRVVRARRIQITDLRTGRRIPILPRGGRETYSLGRNGLVRGTVAPPHRGTYLVRTVGRGRHKGATVAFGGSLGGTIGGRVGLPLALGVLLATAGVAVAVITFVRRSVTRRALRHGKRTPPRAATVEPVMLVHALERVVDVTKLVAARQHEGEHRSGGPLSFWYGLTQGGYAYSVEEVRERDDRPPILLLRSFVGDAAPWRADSIESAIVDGLWRWGPVITAAKPVRGIGSLGEAREEYQEGVGRSLVWKTKTGKEFYARGFGLTPPPGAARARIPSERWQETVLAWMTEARLIVAMMGGTEGIAWEMDQIRRLQFLRRLVLVFPPTRHHTLPGVTVSSDVLAETDSSRIRVMFSRGHDRAVAVSSRYHRSLDYQVAVEVATMLMLGGAGVAPPTRYRESSGLKRFLGG
jgi:hypothetical protein